MQAETFTMHAHERMILIFQLHTLVFFLSMTDDLVVIQGNILACSYRLLSAFFAQ